MGGRDEQDGVAPACAALPEDLQRPPTTHGVAFGVIEDETGTINLASPPPVRPGPLPPRPPGLARKLPWRPDRTFRGTVNVAVTRAEGFALASPTPDATGDDRAATSRDSTPCGFAARA